MNRTFVLDLQKLIWLKFSLWEMQIQHSQMVTCSFHQNQMVTKRHQANPPDLKMSLFFIQSTQSCECLLEVNSCVYSPSSWCWEVVFWRIPILYPTKPQAHCEGGTSQADRGRAGGMHKGLGGNEWGQVGVGEGAAATTDGAWEASVNVKGQRKKARNGTVDEKEGKERARRRGKRSTVVLGQGEGAKERNMVIMTWKLSSFDVVQPFRLHHSSSCQGFSIPPLLEGVPSPPPELT